MRFLISVLLIVTATGLFCHGFFLEEQARAVLDGGTTQVTQPPKDEIGRLFSVTVDWPYTQSAVEARDRLARAWAEIPPVVEPDERTLPEKIRGGVQADIQDAVPFLLPRATAALALLALILAIFMPGQRFRSLAFLAFILGAGALYPLFMGHDEVGRMVSQFPPTLHLYAWGPWIAIGLVFLGGLLVSARRRPSN